MKINNSKELSEAIKKGNKRLAIICTIWSIIFSIPLLFINEKYLNIITIYSYLIIVIIGMRLSPKICNLIWKK